MANKFEFRSTEGKVCCSTDNPARLCASCASKAASQKSLEAPDPYESGLQDRALVQADITPDLDPHYEPYGKAPDGYMLDLARRKVNAAAQRAAGQKPERKPAIIRTADGIPDGYATALAERNGR
jgi:hypothetical protein